MTPARRIVVHDLSHALAAAAAAEAAGLPVVVMSPPAAAGYLGAPFFRLIVEAARRRHPRADVTAVLDCGDAAGFALAALRDGATIVRIEVADDVRRRLADIAAQAGARLDEEAAPQCLDLLDEIDPLAACRRWLDAPSP